jgi:hypothetical protein
MAEIATWSAILNKTGLGKTSNECPTKAELLALNNGKDSNVDKVIVISNAASYGNNECVKLEDINAEQWIYTFQWDPNGNPSFNAPATGGTYPFGSYASNRVKQVNGVNTTISQSLVNDVTKTSEGSWYTTDYDGNKGRIVPNNTSTNSKSITVTWTQKYSGKTIQATFTQAAGRKVYSSWSYNCRVDKTSFSYSGGQSNVTAKSASRTYTWNGQGSSYTESETATVRVSSPASISGNSISIPSNSGSARNFTVTFDFPTATDQTISISQEGGQVTYVDHLSIDPTTKNVPGTGSSFRLTVNANYDKYINGTYVENIRTTYTSAEVVEGTSSDITISGKSSSGCNISVAPNHNSSPRTFKIKFTYDTATPVYLTIIQNSAEVTYPSSGMVFEHSTQQNSGYKTSTLSIGTVEGKGGNISFYIKSYRSRYVNGSLSSTEAIKPTLILPPGVTETITNVSGYYFKVTITIPEHSKPASRTLTIRANQPNGLDRELVQTVQQSASTYEFGIRENSEDSLSTSLTYSGWPSSSSDSSYNRPVRVYSRKNGNQFLNWALSSNVDWITISGSGAGATYKVATNNSSSSRTGIITFTQGESNKTCTLTIVQEAGDVYEFYITDSEGNGHYTDFTFTSPSNGMVNKHVLNIISTHNGSPLSIDDMEVVHSEIVEKLIGTVITPDTQSPFGFRANITGNGSTVKTGADTYRQKASGKTVIFRVLQEAKINNFRLELSLNISNGNDQDTWGLFDTANMPHTSDSRYDMSLIREGIVVDSVEGKITVNSLQSPTKDIGVGDNVYVWAYNSVRGLWLSIGNFGIEEGNNTYHWDVSWPT